jgi:tetratricopeptide (TPR) repeat protein
MKYLLLLSIFCSYTLLAQNTSTLIQQAEQLERQLKEADASNLYQAVLLQDPRNVQALCKLAELQTILGEKATDKKTKQLYFETSYSFAKRAWLADSNRVESNYVMAMASGKMTDFESDNKKVVGYVRDIKDYAERAIKINPNYGKAQYVLGKWHYEMYILSGFKKAAVKLMYGGLPSGDPDIAIACMEKCRTLEPYFVSNYLDLGRAYKEVRKPTQAIDVLTKLQKLPNRNSADPLLKAAGATLLATLQ